MMGGAEILVGGVIFFVWYLTRSGGAADDTDITTKTGDASWGAGAQALIAAICFVLLLAMGGALIGGGSMDAELMADVRAGAGDDAVTGVVALLLLFVVGLQLLSFGIAPKLAMLLMLVGAAGAVLFVASLGV